MNNLIKGKDLKLDSKIYHLGSNGKIKEGKITSLKKHTNGPVDCLLIESTISYDSLIITLISSTAKIYKPSYVSDEKEEYHIDISVTLTQQKHFFKDKIKEANKTVQNGIDDLNDLINKSWDIITNSQKEFEIKQ